MDKDGDLDMEAAGGSAKDRGAGRGSRGGSQSRGTVGSRFGSGRDTNSSRLTRGSVDPTGMQKAILRGMGVDPRGSGLNSRTTKQAVKSLVKERDLNARAQWEQVIVRGFRKSKAASNPGGGIKDLIAFLERKATALVQKSRLDGDALIISIKSEDVPKFTKLDTFIFAGASLEIAHYHGENTNPQGDVDGGTNEVSTVLTDVLTRRYDPALKLLDLSNLGTDPELINIGMFSTTARESKLFPALMKILDSFFTTAEEKVEAIHSVSLASNALTSTTSVYALAQTLPALQNLDLSNNQLRDLNALKGWRWKFRGLNHLILSGNPLESEVPSYKDDILKWYPSLRILNNEQVRSSDEAKDVSKNETPIPIAAPSFRDEAGIGETFVKMFFPAYDSDRTALINAYYDTSSTFSLSVNISAPRSPETAEQKSPSWDSYIKRSRNLVKVTHLPAKMSRICTGTENIQQCWLTLPSTQHPNLLTEPEKWCIECNAIPGLPDPSGQSLGGVGGLIVTIHGEFFEVNVSTGMPTCRRSFDRTFVLGPGAGAGGVRVACDALVLRAWGGSQAWKEDATGFLLSAAPPQPRLYPIQVPRGFGASAPGKTDEQVRNEVLALELSTKTGMTLDYSGECLKQSGWTIKGALVAFEQVKANLPPEAFFMPI